MSDCDSCPSSQSQRSDTVSCEEGSPTTRTRLVSMRRPLAIVAMPALLLLASCSSDVAIQERPVPTQKEASVAASQPLEATLRFAAPDFVISNTSADDWLGVLFETYPLPVGDVYRLYQDRIGAGETIRVDSTEFLDSRGRPFDSATQVPAALGVHVQIASPTAAGSTEAYTSVVFKSVIRGTRDVSMQSCVRMIVDVTLTCSSSLTDNELLSIAWSAAQSVLDVVDVNAIGVFFWPLDASIGQEPAIASVDWAPHGNWEAACEAATGDYSTHELRVDFNQTWVPGWHAQLGTASYPSTAKKREIFYNLVALQDSIPESDPRWSEKNDEAKDVIAQRYGISRAALGDIIMEGASNGWPMPPPP